MKKISIVSLFLMAVVSCQIAELNAPVEDAVSEVEQAVYYVGMEEEVDTKTSSTIEGDILWSAGDKMNIFYGPNNNDKDFLELKGGEGTKNGSFYGPYIVLGEDEMVELHQTVIAYPFDENATCVPNEDKTAYTLSMNIPAVQQYVEGSFANGAYPMVGVTENPKQLVIETKNVASIINFRLKGTASISKIVLSSDKLALAGPASVVASYGNVPVATITEETASKTVELICDGGVQLAEDVDTYFNIVVAPCSGAINVTFFDTAGGYTVRTLPADANYKRGGRVNYNHVYTGENSIQKDLAKAFKNGGEYTLPMDVTVSDALLITGGKTLNLDLNGYTLTSVADLGGTNGNIQTTGASLNICNGTINNKSGYLFVTNGYNNNLHLELTDVDVKGSATSVFYFADATDIVLNNVNVDIKGKGFYSFAGTPKGIIEIDGGTYKTTGKIFDFKSTLPVVFKGNCLFSKNDYAGAQWVESGDDVYEWKPVGYNVFVGTKGYYSISDAVAAVKTSATITIASDYEMTESVVIPADKSIVLDLNGKTISQTRECTASYSLIDNKGQLTITGNGAIRFEDLSEGGGDAWGSYIINNTGELVVENGTLEHLGTADGNFDTCIPIQNYAGKVTVNDGLISSPEFRSLRDFTAGGEIIINGGKFNGQIWMQGLGNGTSSLTINGGEFGPTANDGSSIFITNGTNDVKVAIAGGKFSTKIGCTDASKSGVVGCIAGGLFTESAVEKTNAALLKSGFIFAESGNESYPYTPKFDVKATVGGVEYNTVAEAFAAAQEGQTVTVKAGTYAFPSMKEGVIVDCEDGTVFEGTSGLSGAKNVTIKNAVFTNTSSLQSGEYRAFTGNLTNATFVGCKFDSRDGARYMYAYGDVVFTDCVFGNEGCIRGVHFDGGNGTVTFNECTLYGFQAIGSSVSKVTFNNCTFEYNKNYNVVNMYGAYEYNNCVFNLSMNTDCAGNGVTATFSICTYSDGTSVNYDTLVRFDKDPATCTIVADGYTRVADGLWKKGVEYNVSNAAGLSQLNTMFANQTAGRDAVLNLTSDINFEGYTWTTVDSHADSKFEIAEINGNGHTISNLTINGQAMFKRFAGSGNVVVKDITFDKATVNSNALNTSILTVQTYQNVLLDNVDVKNSSITGAYKVAPLIATVYNESSSTITATLKNCDVENVTVKATKYDFCTTGMVAFVNAGNNDAIEFENCTVKNVKLYAPNSYTAHAAIYTTGSETLFNEAEGVTVENVTFENI